MPDFDSPPAVPSPRYFLGLRHLALNVRDAQASKRFYCDLFGMRVEWEPDPSNVYLTSGHDNLALHTNPDRARPGALDHLGFVTTKIDEVDLWESRVRAIGAEIVAPVRTHRDGARSFYFKDPDGNVIQILYHPPLSHLPTATERSD